MKNKFIYEIQGLYHPGLDETKMGVLGFGVDLDPSFAIKAREEKMGKKLYDNLQKVAVIITTNFGLDNYFGNPIKLRPYHFIEDSLLLQFVDIPSNSCNLGMYGGKNELLDNWERTKKEGYFKYLPIRVNYIPHNVDTRDQNSCLLSLWIHWANTVKSILLK